MDKDVRRDLNLPDPSLVVRGGLTAEESFLRASGVKIDSNGRLEGISVQSAPDRSVKELVGFWVPHKRIGVTTAGKIRAAGGYLLKEPLRNNPYHCVVSGLTAAQLAKLLSPSVPTPRGRS
ncbi:MAG: flavoredoxin [Actinomycetota bacterium]